MKELFLAATLFLNISARIPEVNSIAQVSTFSSIYVAGIQVTSTKIGNWNTAFGWGNHASAGYLTASSTNTLTNKSGNISQWTNDAGYLVHAPSVNSGVTRAVNSSTYTISSLYQAIVAYSIQISCTASIGSASAGSLLLQYSINGGSSWVDVSTIKNSNTVTLAVVLNLANVQIASLFGVIPANALVRMVPTTSGTTTITFISGQETY